MELTERMENTKCAGDDRAGEHRRQEKDKLPPDARARRGRRFSPAERSRLNRVFLPHSSFL